MRRSASRDDFPPASASVAPRSDWATLQRLFPYLWEYKWRAGAALAFMLGAKLANVGVPLLLKELVDALSFKPGDVQAVLVVPMALLLLLWRLWLWLKSSTSHSAHHHSTRHRIL